MRGKIYAGALSLDAGLLACAHHGGAPATDFSGNLIYRTDQLTRVRSNACLSLWQVKRAVPGYSHALFFQDITAIYLGVNKALAAGDVAALRTLVTERTLAQMKQELEFRQKGGWERVTWELPKPSAIQRKTVHGRLVSLPPFFLPWVTGGLEPLLGQARAILNWQAMGQ